MADVMGYTPGEFGEMPNAQIAETERKTAAMSEFVATPESACVTGFGSCREAEAEVSQGGTMIRVSINDETLEDSIPDLEEATMEAYPDAGENMSRFLHGQGYRQFGDGDLAMDESVDQISSCLEQLGC